MSGWKRALALLLFAVLLLSFGGCGKETMDNAVTAVTEVSSDSAYVPAKRTVRKDLMDLVLADLGAERSELSDIRRGSVSDSGEIEISFLYRNRECTYVLDAYTGEILSKNVPELSEEYLVNEAIDAAIAQARIDYAERHPDVDLDDPKEQEDPKNIGYSVSSMINDGRCINVHFNWKKEFFNYDYDTVECAIRIYE